MSKKDLLMSKKEREREKYIEKIVYEILISEKTVASFGAYYNNYVDSIGLKNEKEMYRELTHFVNIICQDLDIKIKLEDIEETFIKDIYNLLKEKVIELIKAKKVKRRSMASYIEVFSLLEQGFWKSINYGLSSEDI